MWNPPNPKVFNPIVWMIAKQIPSGKVSTYGQIASMIPPPEGVSPPDYRRMGARWVGTAMNATPQGEGIPWQRVINSKGEISLPAGTPGAHQQRTLLEDEDITFDESERIDFEAFGWDGPDETWLKAHGLHPPRSLKKSGGKPKPQQPKLF